MPQLQVVDTTPNEPEPSGVEKFFSKLSKSYQEKQESDELGNLLKQYQGNRQDANALEDYMIGVQTSPKLSPSKKLEAIGTFSEIRKTINEKDKALALKAKALEAQNKAQQLAADKKAKEEKEVLKSQKQAEETKEILRAAGESEEEAERLSKVLTPTSAGARYREKNVSEKIQAKKTEKQQEEEKSQRIAQNAYNDIVKLIPKAGLGTEALSVFGKENARTSGQFKSLTGALEALLVDKVSRGTLSNTRFKYITETLLPKPSDTQASIKGKMKGLATILELDSSELDALEGNKPKAQEKPAEGKVRVKIKGSNPPVYGSVTPYEGMEEKYDIVK